MTKQIDRGSGPCTAGFSAVRAVVWRRVRKSVPFVIGALVLVLPATARAHSVKGAIFYTIKNPPPAAPMVNVPGVKKVQFNYNGASLTLGTKSRVAFMPNADGLIFAPDGDIVAGEGGSGIVHKFPPSGAGPDTTVAAGGGQAFHLALDPRMDRVWTAGLPGLLSEVPLSPYGTGTPRAVSGDDTEVTGIAFDRAAPPNAYYTASGPGGHGHVGRIDLSTFTTTRVHTALDGAHAIVHDPFSNTMLLFGDQHITQLSLPSLAIMSELDFSVSHPGLILDQGAVDGKGHIFVADNNGSLVFVDYFNTKALPPASGQYKVEFAAFTSVQFLDTDLDDVAPLASPGGPETTAPTCVLTNPGAIDGSGKVYVEFTVQDAGSGLDTITSSGTNCVITTSPSAFLPGYTLPVIVRATKINNSQRARFTITATDVVGNVTECDPIMEEIVIPAHRSSAVRSYSDLPRIESYVTFVNGTPGVRVATIHVNRTRPVTRYLAPGEQRTLNVATAMREARNRIQIAVSGAPGSRVTVLIMDGAPGGE